MKDNRLFEILEIIKPMRASQRWGSFRDILKLGKSVTKTVPAFRVVWTIPMTAFWYSKNLESRSEILETTGSPFFHGKLVPVVQHQNEGVCTLVFAKELQTL